MSGQEDNMQPSGSSRSDRSLHRFTCSVCDYATNHSGHPLRRMDTRASSWLLSFFGMKVLEKILPHYLVVHL